MSRDDRPRRARPVDDDDDRDDAPPRRSSLPVTLLVVCAAVLLGGVAAVAGLAVLFVGRKAPPVIVAPAGDNPAPATGIGGPRTDREGVAWDKLDAVNYLLDKLGPDHKRATDPVGLHVFLDQARPEVGQPGGPPPEGDNLARAQDFLNATWPPRVYVFRMSDPKVAADKMRDHEAVNAFAWGRFLFTTRPTPEGQALLARVREILNAR